MCFEKAKFCKEALLSYYNFVLLLRAMVPMTKEEYDKQQSIVRRVYDPDTGRNRYEVFNGRKERRVGVNA